MSNVVIEDTNFTVPATKELVHVIIYGKYNGSGRIRRDPVTGKVYIMEYTGIFPSSHPEDTDQMLYALEDFIRGGLTHGVFEQRKRNVRWNTSIKKEDY